MRLFRKKPIQPKPWGIRAPISHVKVIRKPYDYEKAENQNIIPLRRRSA